MASYVADTGFLRDDGLVDFLSKSISNTVAIAEYTCMECYQGDALVNIERSLRHLCRFPAQVVVLRWASALVGDQDKSGRALVRADLVERDQTEHFPEFCRGVRAAIAGDLTVVRQIRATGDAASKQLQVLRDGAVLVAQGIKGIASEIDQDRLKHIRKDEPFTACDIDWFLRQVLAMARFMFDSHPEATRLPGPGELRGSWLFRYALAGCLLMRRWIQDGGIESTPTKKLSNDIIDMTIATYGTYFDGVLSRDAKLLALHQEMRWVLEQAFDVDVGV